MKKLLLVVALFLAGTLSAGATTLISDPEFDSTGRDFTQVTGGYDSQNAYFTATFRAGTLNTNNLGFAFYLNTDMNAATGTGDFGIDYSIFFHPLNRAIFAEAFVTNTANGVQSGMAPVDFVAESLSVAVPLSWLGNDDGVMQFRALVGDAVFGDVNPVTGRPRRLISPQDWALDQSWAGTTTPTAPVPEPSTFILLGAGLAGLVAWRRKRS